MGPCVLTSGKRMLVTGRTRGAPDGPANGCAVADMTASAPCRSDGSGPERPAEEGVTACEVDGGPGTYRTDALIAQERTVRIPPPIPPRAQHCTHNAFYAQLASEVGGAERFWSKVDRRGPDECWPWLSSAASKGYGRFRVGRLNVHSNRAAWALANGRDPGGLIVRHSCDNPPCCNPRHLLLGTHADNTQDKVERGRARTGRQDGENNGAALLTTEQVGQIVEAFRAGLNNQQVARRFPVSDSLISRIRTGRSWRRESASFGWQPQRLVRHRVPLAESFGEVA
jgi:hypothetical protein